ncbi:hypothetical protein EB47_00194 [Enterococcus faecium]|nr:hypothetical protein EB47_00194 [Enterococcus faecium]
MRNKTIGYIRTSKNTQDLGLEVQRKALEKFEPDELFSEQISGRKEHRTELDKALKRLEKGEYQPFISYLKKYFLKKV